MITVWYWFTPNTKFSPGYVEGQHQRIFSIVSSGISHYGTIPGTLFFSSKNECKIINTVIIIIHENYDVLL
jgi:hypothetical protein